MKRIRNLYWATTGLFAAFMAFSAIPDILVLEEARQFILHLGYPAYFVPFIGVAKLLGSMAILAPGFPKIQEWAYAGLFFDLIGAVYSNLMTDGFQPSMFMMLPVLGIAIASYVYSRQYQKLRATPHA